ncbi:MAG: PIN domain-containing protein [Streptosporangiales bacterium]|nr:PIN domain-containing protein [Streptosporangiales bacterium]
MTVAVLDASAFLAYLRDENGAERVVDALGEGCVISAANWAEVLTKVADLGQDPAAFEDQIADEGLLGGALEVVALEPGDAVTIARLRSGTRSAGLSLDDRACLALALRRGLPALTADHAWTRLDLDVNVQAVR